MSDLVAPPVWYHGAGGSSSRRFADVVETGTLWTADDYDAVLVGEPFGARAARPRDPVPTLVREALARTEVTDDEGFATTVADLGDVNVNPTGTGPADVRAAIRAFTRRIYDRETVPVFLSGGGTFTYPNAAPLLDATSLGVVRFGAVRGYGAGDWHPASRRSYRQFFDAGLDALAVVGTRPAADAANGWGLLAEHDWREVTRDVVRERPGVAAAGALSSMDDVGTVFVSVDLSALSVSDDQLRAMLRRVATDDRIAGLEVIARGSTPDRTGPGTHAAAEAVAHFLLGYE